MIRRLFGIRDRVRRLIRERRDRRRIISYLNEHDVRRLHIGSGSNILEEWLNTNYGKTSLMDRYNVIWMDATARFPFDERSFNVVFSEHMIEHVPYERGAHMIRECFRVLESGGTIRIAAPNLHFLLELFAEEKTKVQEEFIDFHIREWMPELIGDTAKKETLIVNSYMRRWGHQFIYDPETLCGLLGREGFESICAQDVGSSEVPALCGIESGPKRMDPRFYRLQTMIYEARKPVQTGTRDPSGVWSEQDPTNEAVSPQGTTDSDRRWSPSNHVRTRLADQD